MCMEGLVGGLWLGGFRVGVRVRVNVGRAGEDERVRG